MKLLACARDTMGLKMLLLLFLICALSAFPISTHAQSGAPPLFPSATAVRFLEENLAPFHPVGTPIVATDPDPHDTPTYSLTGRDVEFFRIAKTSGQLEAARPMDYETRSSYSVTVRATDSGGLYDTIPVSIEVTNVDEIGEIVISQEAFDEGTELNAVLMDPDGSIADVSWHWSVSIDRTAWKDIPGAGASTYSPLPEDLRRFLRVQARYTDGHGPGKVASTLFATDLWSPVANHSPEFPFAESGVRSVGTNASAGQQVGQPVLASDLDRDLLTYWLTGDASQFFAIGAHTGQLTTKSSLNPEIESRYFGVVHVLDGRGGSAYKSVRIDVGEFPVPAVLPSAAVSPILVPGDTAPTPAAQSETDSSANPAAASAPPQSGSHQVPAEASGPAGLDLLAEAVPSSAQFMRGDAAPTLASSTRGKLQPEVEKETAGEADQEPMAVLAAIGPSPPLSPGEGVDVKPVGPGDENGTASSAETNGFMSLFAWLALLFAGLALLAGIVALCSRRKRGKKTDISLPPPSMGPERRIGPLPVLVSLAGENDTANVGSG